MEIWNNGQQPSQESPKQINYKFEKQKDKHKQVGIGTYILWYIIIFCIVGTIFGGKM